MKNVRQVTPFNARVAIVGAGLAGISAAQHLVKNGFKNVTILEAKNRIGGRIDSRRFGRKVENIVELGANWIHGACAANSFFTLANQMDLLPGPLHHLDRMSGYCYKPGGGVVKPSLVNRVWDMFRAWEEEEPAFASPDQRVDIHTYLQQRLADNLTQFSAHQHSDVLAVFNCLVNLSQFENGGFLRDTPQTDIDGYRGLPGGNVKVPLGVGTVLEAALRDLPEGCVRFSEEAERITWNGYEARVHCRSGSLYLAENIILTLPLGVLKKKAAGMFDPPLPEAKVKAIDAIGCGKVNKVVLYWDEPFWKEGEGGIKFAWPEEDVEGGATPQQWYKKIFAFDEVHDNRNVLIGWISGSEADYMEQLSDEEVNGACTDLIRDFLGNPSIPRASRLLRSSWCRDQHFLGAYSYRTQTTTAQDHRELAEPVFQASMPRLLFAGEATSVTAYSTMNGARDSGIREAERLCEYYEVQEHSHL